MKRPRSVHGVDHDAGPETGTADHGSTTGTESEAAETMRGLGAEIRRLRRTRGLTLQDVAARTGLSVSMLSMLERGVAGGSIGTLVAVSSALDVQVAQLFQALPADSSPVHRRAEQPQVEPTPGVLRRTVHHDASTGVEMVVLTLAPGMDTGRAPIRHDGPEYLLVSAGRLTVVADDDRYVLETGDGMHIAPGVFHRFGNETAESAEAVLVSLADRR